MLPRCQCQRLAVGRHFLPISVRLTSKAYFTSGRYLYRMPKQETPKTENNPRSKTVWELLEPRWKRVQSQLNETRSLINRYTSQISLHASKAKESIREANKKLAEQERESSDQRLNYNKDIETSGKIEGLPSQRELHRRKWSRKLEFYLDSLQETIFTATRALNDVTGYSSIQRLRKSIELMEKSLEESRTNLKILKDKYATAIEERTKSQKELNELLQRKSSWSPTDLERFTEIYKDDAVNLKREQNLKEEVTVSEAKQEEMSDDLYRAILTRYHEEQIWSDKIRRTSTWGTFILMGVNIFLFLVFQLLLEPWKRRRLTRSFEDKVKKALDQYAIDQNLKLEEMSANLNKDASGGGTRSEETSITEKEENLTQNIEQQEPSLNVVEEERTTERASDVIFSESHEKKLSIKSIWTWVKALALKFRHSRVFQANSQTTLSNIELLIYSVFLITFGAVSTLLM